MAQTRTPPRPKLTKTEHLAMNCLFRNLKAFEDETILDYTLRDQIPEAWSTLEQDLDVEEKKTKVALWVDDSVAKFYRAMGKGYQGRITRVLATYAQLKISKERSFEAFVAEKEREDREVRLGLARHLREEEG